MKLALAATLLAGASAFTPMYKAPASTALFNGPEIGAGGMADTRNPNAMKHEDPRKSISEAPSFEEYLKMRSGGGGAPAPAPAAPAPAAPAPAAYSPPPAAPAPAPAHSGPVIGAGGMADTRDPAAMKHEDPRKSISEAPSFEEYLKMRDGGGAAPAAAAPAPAAPAAAAPAPAAPAVPESSNPNYGKYDEMEWNMDAKMDVYNSWDPNSPRSPNNFNPFETWDGNSPDCSGFYPGEGRYKDPKRPDVNFAQMQEERKILEDIAANPKPGAGKGCPGCRNK
eukprot:CAMPEP_0176047900 /NCGR_PEP_ID=MMETSP0120_2-20121206/23791_1 /TAXON_ID=160619 /ORGANISM="Kryptoperidinium foliaceum, Strain CCMP 1326" /LENGTH=280 /DNA_ID=CAMNT_0017381315 /DNA_START=50 /DNA_END=892 /DNA_ORIENTATION=+